MSALFNFNSFLTVVLLVICTCTFVNMQFPAVLEQKTGFRGFFWTAARIGERLSPWVAAGCFTMGILSRYPLLYSRKQLRLFVHLSCYPNAPLLFLFLT